MPHREPVIVLYGDSEIFSLLIPFLLRPTLTTLRSVFAVLGTGIWVGVQHLGYLEFGELRRVALRTMEQRQIIVNNLAIRRATAELEVTQDYDQLCRILVAAFGSNDFDAFELRPGDLPLQTSEVRGLRVVHGRNGDGYFHWKKPGSLLNDGTRNAWTLNIDLGTGSGRYTGTLTLYRLYTSRALQLDINLLTSDFPVVLAEAVDRSLAQGLDVLLGQTPNPLPAAQVG